MLASEGQAYETERQWPAAGLAVEPYVPSYRSELLAFRRSLCGAGTPASDPDEVSWRYERHANRGGRLWLYRSGSNVLAQQGVLPVRLTVGHKEIAAAWAIDDLTRPGGLDKKAAAMLASRSFGDCPVVLAWREGQAGIPAGFFEVGSLPRFRRVLDAGELCSYRFGSGSWHLAGTALGTPLILLDKLIAARLSRRRVRLFEIDSFDGRADALWEQLRGEHAIVARRGREQLNWRFADVPERGRYRKFYVLEGEVLRGYIVLKITRGEGIHTGHIVDYFCHTGWSWFLLAAGMLFLRRARVAQVVCNHMSAAGERALLQLGFLKKPSGRKLLCRARGIEAAAGAQLARAQSWFLTEADGDAGSSTLS